MKQLFNDVNGKFSSKRLAGFILIISGVIMAFMKYDIEYFSFMVVTGAGLLGWGTFERPNKLIKTDDNPPPDKEEEPPK